MSILDDVAPEGVSDPQPDGGTPETSVDSATATPAGEIKDKPDSSKGEDQPWYSDIDESLLTDKIQRFKSKEDLVKSYNEAQKLISQKGMQPPSEDASPEEFKKFFQQIGAPESPDGYEYDIPEGSFIDDGVLDTYKQAALEAGATPYQFKVMMDKVNEAIESDFQAQEAEILERTNNAREALKKEWGSHYEENIKEIDNTLTRLGVSEDSKSELRQSGLAANTEIIKMLNNVSKMMSENNVSRSERFGDVKAEIEQVKAARDAESDPLKYDKLHSRYVELKQKQKGAI